MLTPLSREERRKKNYELRDLFWNQAGRVDQDVLTFAVNPAFMGQPEWPDLRQAYKRIVTEDSVIIATDGLSDEFSGSDSPNNGLEIELYVELNDPEFMRMSLQELGKTWAFELLYQAALNAVHSGAYGDAAKKYGVFSTAFYDVLVPYEWIDKYIGDEGSVGVLLGVGSDKVPSRVKLVAQEVSMISITLLRLDELGYIMNQGAAGRKEIVEQLKARGIRNTCSVKRESVISRGR